MSGNTVVVVDVSTAQCIDLCQGLFLWLFFKENDKIL